MRSEARRNQNEISTISEALAVLDSAAQRSTGEVRRILRDDYESLKRTLSDVVPEIESAVRGIRRESVQFLREAKDRASETTREAVDTVDRQAHENPWWFVGGAMLTGATLGYLAARKRSNGL